MTSTSYVVTNKVNNATRNCRFKFILNKTLNEENKYYFQHLHKIKKFVIITRDRDSENYNILLYKYDPEPIDSMDIDDETYDIEYLENEKRIHALIDQIREEVFNTPSLLKYIEENMKTFCIVSVIDVIQDTLDNVVKFINKITKVKTCYNCSRSFQSWVNKEKEKIPQDICKKCYINYTSFYITDASNDTCPICQEKMKPKIDMVTAFRCKHFICSCCFLEYLRTSRGRGVDVKCPYCRNEEPIEENSYESYIYDIEDPNLENENDNNDGVDILDLASTSEQHDDYSDDELDYFENDDDMDNLRREIRNLITNTLNQIANGEDVDVDIEVEEISSDEEQINDDN